MLTSSALGHISFLKFPGWEPLLCCSSMAQMEEQCGTPQAAVPRAVSARAQPPPHNPLHTPCSTPETMSSLPSLMAPGHTQVCQLGRGACPKSSPG